MPDPRGLHAEISHEHPIPLRVSLTCRPDEALAVFGPSGSGKTTLLRCIAGLRDPGLAKVVCDGETWADTGSRKRLPPHRRRVGMVFQDYALFPHLTAHGNVRAALGHLPAPQRDRAASDWLASVHLSELASRRPDALSGGERQRVALARALARDPRVLLLDEPFAAIDRPTRRQLHQLLDELRRRLRIPVVIVTHDFEDVVRLATHVLLLERGAAVATGPIESLTSRPDLPWARYGVGAGSVFDASVRLLDRGRGLAELTSPAGTLVVPLGRLTTGARVRVRLPAREIILATTPPAGLSLHNVLASRVLDVAAAADHALVRLHVGDLHLLAEVTRDAIERLDLGPGRAVFALVKSVSFEIYD